MRPEPTLRGHITMDEMVIAYAFLVEAEDNDQPDVFVVLTMVMDPADSWNYRVRRFDGFIDNTWTTTVLHEEVNIHAAVEQYKQEGGE